MKEKQLLDIVNIIKQFDDFLSQKNIRFEATIIGGAAFNLLKIKERKTVDVDIIIPSIMPDNIKKYADEFAELQGIDKNWINTGPTSVTPLLPNGWEERTKVAYQGSSICFKTLGRLELLMTKCWAYMDRGDKDYSDILALRPTTFELLQTKIWLKPLDGHPDWPRWVDLKIDELDKNIKKELNKGIGF